MPTIAIILCIILSLAVIGLVIHAIVAAHKREELIRYYENQRNDQLQKQLEEAKEQWNRDNQRLKEEFNELIEKRAEALKNFKEKNK